MPWDWWFVGELIIGVGVGIGAGGWFVVDRLEIAAMRIVTNPSVRKIANAADKFAGGEMGGWPGVVGKIVDGGLSLFGGGRNEVPVLNEAGDVVGSAVRKGNGWVRTR